MDVRLPNGAVIRGVPEGTSKDEIMEKAISSGLAKREDFGAPSEAMGTETISEKPKEKRTFFQDLAAFAENDNVIGGAENLLTFLTGLVATPTSGYAGILGEAEDIAPTSEALTYRPRFKAGQTIQQNLGAKLAPIGEAISRAETFLGDVGYDLTGSPAVAAGMATIPTAAMELLGLKGSGKVRKAIPKNVVPEKPPQLKNTNIRATVGEATQDLAQQKAEQFLLEQTGEAGEQLRGYKLAQSREIRDYLEGVAPDQVDNVGDAVKQALELRENSAKFKRKQAYDKLAELTNDLDFRLNTEVIKGAMPSARDMRNLQRTMPDKFNAIDGLLNEFGFDLTDEGIAKAAKGGYEIEPLSVSNMEDFRKALNAIEQSDQTGYIKTVTGPIKDALDTEFDLASKALQQSGNPDVARAAKNARMSHAALKTEFDEKGITKQLIDTKGYQSKLPKVEESQVYAKLMGKGTPVESVDRVMESLNRAGTKGKRAISQIKSQMVMDLLDSGFSAKSRKINGEQVFGANAFAKRFDDLEPKLKSVMTADEFKKLKKFRDDAQDLIPPDPANPKGSAGFFIEGLKKVGFLGFLNGLPYAGPATADFLTGIGQRSQDVKALEKALKSSAEVKDAVNLLSTQYPSLAVALGIPQLREDEQEQQ